MDMKWPQPHRDFYKKATDPFNEVEVQNSGVLEADFFKYANNFYEAAIVIVNKLIGKTTFSKFMHKENLEYEDKTVVYESYQYTYLGNGNVATVGVITFKENNKIVLFAQDSLIEEFDKEELNNIFASMKLK